MNKIQEQLLEKIYLLSVAIKETTKDHDRAKCWCAGCIAMRDVIGTDAVYYRPFPKDTGYRNEFC